MNANEGTSGMTEENNKRVAEVVRLLPTEWDGTPYSLALEIREFLQTIVDTDTHIDSGTGDGNADLWATIQGVEFYINIRKSNSQLLSEGATRKSLGLPPIDDDQPTVA